MISYQIPKAEDSAGLFIPTLNNTGFAVTNLDYFSLSFIEFSAKFNSKVLEIGAGYGLTTLATLARGVETYCNDIEPRHLEIIKQQARKYQGNLLKTVCGNFPININFENNFFDAILISRVIHLFNPFLIELSMQKIYQWLKPGGKIFLVADTPYLRNFEKFIPEYEYRLKNKKSWPGLISDASQYLDKPRNHIPSLINFLDAPTVRNLLIDNNFEIEELCYMGRDDYPMDRRYDGRESLGAIARKPCRKKNSSVVFKPIERIFSTYSKL